MAVFRILVDGTFSGQALRITLRDKNEAYVTESADLTPTRDPQDNLFYVTASFDLSPTGLNVQGVVYAKAAHRLTGDVANSGEGRGVVYNIDAAGNIIPPETNAGLDNKMDQMLAAIADVDADLVVHDTNLTTRADTLDAGQASLDTALSTHDTDIKTVIGIPTNVDIATDIANHDAKLVTHDTDIKQDIVDLDAVVDAGFAAGAKEATLGVPTGASVSADIAALQSSVDGIDNSDVLAILGTPVTTVSGDIAAVKAVVDSNASNIALVLVDTDQIQYIERADAPLAPGELTEHIMSEWLPGGPEELSGGRNTIEGIRKITP